MRLDHLLSKEHWHLELLAHRGGGSVGVSRWPAITVRVVGVAQGWNIGYLALHMWRGREYWLSLRGWLREVGAPGGWCLARCWVLRARAFFARLFSAGLACWSNRCGSAFVAGLWQAPACGGVPPVF